MVDSEHFSGLSQGPAGLPLSWERGDPAVMIGRSLKCTAERDQRFVAKRTANELHPDRQSRFRLPRWHHQARQAEKVRRPHEACDGLDRCLRFRHSAKIGRYDRRRDRARCRGNDHIHVPDGVKMRSKRRSAPTQRREVLHRAIRKSVLQPITHLRT